jgi:NADPH:quinone reductase-like Zn-dependent oxidoreductase
VLLVTKSLCFDFSTVGQLDGEMRRELRLILKHLRSVLDPRETLVIVGGETGGRWLAGSDRQLRALLLSPFTGQTLTTLLCSENAADLLALTKLIESGQVKPVIDQTYPLSQTPAAIQYMRDGHAQGKVVINL